MSSEAGSSSGAAKPSPAGGAEEGGDRPAKKARTEGHSAASVDELLLECCRDHPQWIAPQDQTGMTPPKDYTNHTLDSNPKLEGVDQKLLTEAVGRLLGKSRLTLANHPKGGRCLRYVSAEVAQQQVERFGGLSANELLVYQKIEEAKNRGLFQKDLKAKTGITNPNVIKNIIDKLVRRRLIKDFTSVHTGKKKMYILADLEPSAELTGGNWYTNGELDVDLVDTCYKMAHALFKAKQQEGASVKDVQSFILVKSKGVIKCDLTCEEVLQLVGTLVYDGLLTPMDSHQNNPAPERRYRLLPAPSSTHEHYSSIPLSICPVSQGGSQQLDYWLSL
mmetsp:Transcript_28762/g.72394  ORF Transcript_28762/g.72394 Transcript_28762/m.72394 type:complete len:334 (+) Transcript_28762:111-1112(+)